MSEKYGFFNGTDTDIREYRAEDFAAYFNMFLNSGVATINNKIGLQVIQAAGMTVNIDTGFALILGYYYSNDTQLSMSIDAADSTLGRTDRVVLQLDFVARKISAIVKKGTFSSTPAAPALQRDNAMYEISLARINVTPGCATLTTNLIIDERMDIAVCGLISSAITPPVQDMWNNFNTEFGQIQDTWLDWFNQQQHLVNPKISVGATENTPVAGEIWLKTN